MIRTTLGLPVLVMLFEVIEEIAMNFSKCMRCVEQEVVRTVSSFDLVVTSLGVILPHTVVAISQLARYR